MSDTNSLRHGSVNVVHIVFFVVATAGPLISLVGAVPAAIAFGNGAGLVGSFILIALLYLIFSVGFTTMGRYVANAGAFYAYIAQGIGPSIGVGGAFVAILAYTAVQIATYALFGIFSSQAIQQVTGHAYAWWILALFAAVAVHLIGRRAVVFSGRLLGVLLIVEICIVLILDSSIVSHSFAFHISDLAPSSVFGTGFGASLAFVVPCFLGFEATAIFGEEAENPLKTIPRATYTAVAVIGGLYAISTWAIISYYPLANLKTLAANNSSTFVFDIASHLIGPDAVGVMTALMMTSMFAALLSLHNVVSRYLFALARAKLLPAVLARTHHMHQSPYVAGYVQTASVVIIIVLFMLSGKDPYGILFAWTAALGALSILVVQAAASAAVVGFFKKNGHPVGIFSGTIMPALAAFGLAGCVVLLVVNLPLLAGTNVWAIWILPVLPVVCAIAGIIFAKRHATSAAEVEAISA